MIQLGVTQKLYVSRRTDHGVYLTEEYAPSSRSGVGSRYGEGKAAETMRRDSSSRRNDGVLLPKNEAMDVEIGEAVEVFIYRDSSDRLIATKVAPYIQLHQVALLKVASVAKIGAFVEWGLPKDLLLPFKEQTRKVKEGEEILAALYIDKSNRLCLTMNVYEYLSCESPYNRDDHVSGRIYQISERFGAFVAVDNKYSALIPAKEVMPGLRIGQTIEARISDIREDGKLTLSPKEKAYKQMDADAEHVMEVIESFDGVLPFSDSASPEVIKRELGMSKNAFKRAVGRLYKERRVEIKEKSIVKVGR